MSSQAKGRSARLDLRRMLLARGWAEDAESWTLLRKGAVSVSVSGSDAFVSGPASRYRERATATFPSSIPARAITAFCESWAFGGPVGGVQPDQQRKDASDG